MTTLCYARDSDHPPRYTNLMNIASFDPGSRNLGVRIEQRWTEYQPWDRTRLIVLDKWDIKQRSGSTMVNCVLNLYDKLEQLKDYLAKCHYVLVERQLPSNPVAYRVAQHLITQCWGYVRDNGLNTWVVELNSRLKGERLHAPRGIDIKQWSVEEAKHLARRQGDTVTYNLLSSKRGKLDEYSDTTIQIQAWLIDRGLIWDYQPCYRPSAPTS